MIKVYADYFGASKEVPIKLIRFSAGELQPRIEQVPVLDTNSLIMIIDFRSSDDIIEMLLTVDAIRRHPSLRNIKLKAIIPYFPGGRQDRVVYAGEPLSVKVYANIVNSVGFETVEVWDAHSNVTGAVLNNMIHVESSIWARKVPKHSIIIAPDKGARMRAEDFAYAHTYAGEGNRKRPKVFYADKERSPYSGEIKSISVYNEESKKLVSWSANSDETTIHDSIIYNDDFLMVDDISDGGRTFIELAKLIKKITSGSVDLFVTHLIGNGGFDKFNGLIDNIYTPNCFVENPPSPVTIIKE